MPIEFRPRDEPVSGLDCLLAAHALNLHISHIERMLGDADRTAELVALLTEDRGAPELASAVRKVLLAEAERRTAELALRLHADVVVSP
jgi:transposase